jgi:hypothetical protein
MDANRERALALAQDAEAMPGTPPAREVVARAQLYLDFLQGTRDGEIIAAARALASVVSGH